MVEVAYTIVEHDGGWAYKFDGVFSETFPNRAAAEAAATRAAGEQRVPGETEAISWQDRDGAWHEELEHGTDRPEAYVAGVHRGDPGRDAQGVRRGIGAADLSRKHVATYPLSSVLLVGAVGYVLAVMVHGRR